MCPVGDDRRVVSEQAVGREDQGRVLLAMYGHALPEVYGYLVSRCGNSAVAEDLTSETFMSAVVAVKGGRVPNLTKAWLVTVARRRLVDHWRAQAREDRNLALVEEDGSVDEWDELLDVVRAQEVLAHLAPHHRAALTLRYLDGLPVAEVADHLGRTLHATEALLVRARIAFRRTYGERSTDAG
jgi:RNA polymerase sigma-70 factor (ECF subfamily)